MPDIHARTGQELARFLREHRQDIIDRWTAWARTLSPAERLPHEKLVDHIPRIVDRIADMAEQLAAGEHVEPPHESDLHALVRLEEGFDLADVVTEYAILRECIHEVSSSVPNLIPGDVRVLNRAIDQATRATVRRFSEASQRTIKTLDRISTLALGKRTLNELLDELLELLMQTSPAVDSVALLLREGDRLVVRAAKGIIGEREEGFSLKIGEGFAGSIAADRKPRLVRSAMTDPLVESDFLRQSGIRALYGVPLEDGELIGVAHMGSRTAYEFSDEDTLLFRALANRATAVIVEAQLREREREALRSAERAHQTLQSLMDASIDAITVRDREGHYRFVSRSAAAVYGYQPQEVTGRTWSELDIPGADIQEMVNRAIDSGQPQRGEVRVPVEGSERVFEYTVSPIAHSDMAVVIARDVTTRKAIEVERDLFLGILGHDIRNPLAVIKISTHALLRKADALPPGIVRTLGRVGVAVDRMERMISQLLDYARTTHGGGIPLERARIDLARMCRQIIESFEVSHPRASLEFESTGDCTGVWDPDRLHQVVQNLVANAIEHGDPAQPVHIHLDCGDHEAVLRICNQNAKGPIPPELLPRIFDPFRIGHDPAQRTGLGLGLYITKQIVEAHGGSVDVESSIDAGTIFTVRLPR